MSEDIFEWWQYVVAVVLEESYRLGYSSELEIRKTSWGLVL